MIVLRDFDPPGEHDRCVGAAGLTTRIAQPKPTSVVASAGLSSRAEVLGQVEYCGRSSWLKEQAPERSTCEVLSNMKSSFDRREKIITVIILMPLF